MLLLLQQVKDICSWIYLPYSNSRGIYSKVDTMLQLHEWWKNRKNDRDTQFTREYQLKGSDLWELVGWDTWDICKEN